MVQKKGKAIGESPILGENQRPWVVLSHCQIHIFLTVRYIEIG